MVKASPQYDNFTIDYDLIVKSLNIPDFTPTNISSSNISTSNLTIYNKTTAFGNIYTLGNVGIGTTIATAPLTIMNPADDAYRGIIRVGTTNVGAGDCGLELCEDNPANGCQFMYHTGDNKLYTRVINAGVSSTAMTIQRADGNIGIGITTPQVPLHIIGNTYSGSGLEGQQATFVGGSFFKQSQWDANNTTHTIPYPSYCVGENTSGLISIQVANKQNSGALTKIGTILAHWINPNATNITTSQISQLKNANLTTLTITSSANDIVITTDSDCSISWTSIGSF